MLIFPLCRPPISSLSGKAIIDLLLFNVAQLSLVIENAGDVKKLTGTRRTDTSFNKILWHIIVSGRPTNGNLGE